MDEALREIADRVEAAAAAMAVVPAGSLDSHWLITRLLPWHTPNADSALVIQGYHPAMDIPIIADKGLRMLLLDRELVGGLADMVGERELRG
jgi:hypothetical protein